MTVRRQHLVGPAMIAILAIAACGPSDDTPPPSPSGASSSTPAAPSAAPSKTAETAAQRDARLAGEAVMAYWAMINQLGADPDRSLTELSTVARAQALAQWQRNLNLRRGKGQRSVGTTAVEDPVAVYDTKSRTFTVTACIDVTKLNVVDQSGKSVVAASRPDRTRYPYKVEKDDGKFYVIEDLLKGKPC